MICHTYPKQKDLNELINNYKGAFSENKFDIGMFTGFPRGITLDVQEGATAFQRECPVKGIDRQAIDYTIQGLIKAGVFSKATEGHRIYCSNLNCVAKPSSTDHAFVKVRQDLNKIHNDTIPKTRFE